MCELRPAAADPGLISISVFPSLVQDIADRMDKWGGDGKTGRIDPFTEVYNVSLFFRNIFLEILLSFPLSARLRHDRPHDRMSRPGEERSRPQEGRRTVHGLPDQHHPRLLALTLVPQSGNGGKKGGHYRAVHDSLHLRREEEARRAYERCHRRFNRRRRDDRNYRWGKPLTKGRMRWSLTRPF